MDFYERMASVADTILEALMVGMELGEEDCEALRKMHTYRAHQMRLIHYLPLTPESRRDSDVVRLAQHRDFG